MAISQSQDLTTGDVKGVILRFAAPLFLSQLFQQLYNSVDSLIVGNFLGKQALAAVSSSGSLIFLMIGFFGGISVGAGVVISRYYGARERDRVLVAIHTNIAFGLAAGAFLTVFGVVMTPHILRWMGTAPDVIDQSVMYFRVYFLGAIPLVMYNTLTGVMRALGDSRRPLYYLIFSSLLNVALDLLFVGVFRMGVGSAAAATAIAQGSSMLLCFANLSRESAEFRVEFKRIGFDREMLREIVRNGIPAGVQNSVISIANVLVQTYINSFGSDAMAACGSYNKLESFCFLPVMSFSAALTTVVSQNLGAKRYDRAKQAARFGIITAVALSEVIAVLIIAFSNTLVGLFNDDPAVIAI
ncbi:MAG: MATE family efflux transporter, partial [Oscillospiraceae bacterium]|nr:MATE family efflux transporter [Oscillospiraceae bacterium]